MKAINIDYQEIMKFETKIEGVRGKIGVNNDELITRCPENEALCYQIILHKDDINRVFLVYAPNFCHYTINNSFKL